MTGATGFIGQVVAARLEEAGYDVRRAGFTRAGKGVLPLALDPETDFAAALHGCEVVVHLAGRAHVLEKRGADDLAAFRTVNASGTRLLAEAAARAGVRHFIFLSSVAVLGAWNGRPFTDADMPAPDSPYAISKFEGEQALERIAQEGTMAVTILRPPMVYGPGAVGRFAQLQKLVERGVPLPIGGIANKRSVIGVGNLADAIATVVEHGAAAKGAFLVSDDRDVSSAELARAIAVALKRPPRIVSAPLSVLRGAAVLLGRTADVDRLIGSLTVDCSRFRQSLGWRPPLTLEQGLASASESRT